MQTLIEQDANNQTKPLNHATSMTTQMKDDSYVLKWVTKLKLSE
jgi:hypothetical protein